ncbi:MAG: hypothetical protein ACI85K_001515, partial [Hyphomicrobiaceae bacterium]
TPSCQLVKPSTLWSRPKLPRLLDMQPVPIARAIATRTDANLGTQPAENAVAWAQGRERPTRNDFY